MRAGLYARVSSEEQAEGYSIEEQLDAMRGFAAAKGWTIAGEYIEPGVSGTTDDRPSFQRLLADCQQGKVDVLVTHRLDRFFRNLRLQLDTLGRLHEMGVAYVSVTEQIDYSTPHGMLVMSMMGAFNEYYSANLSRETSKGKNGRAKSGKSNASITPYGYKREKKNGALLGPKPDPERRLAVVLAFESYATGQHSDVDVASILNRAGYKPSGRAKSGRWTREGVRYMLNNPFYVGMVRHGDNLHPGQHEPIIDQALWAQVQAIRAGRNRGRSGRNPKRVYLLRRVARCHHCGLPLVAQTSGGSRKSRRGTPTPYYSCHAKRRAFDCASGGRFVPAEVVDAQVAELVMRLELPEDWRQRLVELSNRREERDRIGGKRKYLRGKLNRLHEIYLDGVFDRSEYGRRKAELEAELNALEMPDKPAIEQAAQVMENLAYAWEGADTAARRELLLLVFDAVYVDVLERKLVSVKPHKDFVPLFRLDGLEEREDGRFYHCKDGEAEPAG